MGTPDDYEEYIKKGDDVRIYGRYADIENLGADIEIDDSMEFRRSTKKKPAPFQGEKPSIRARASTRVVKHLSSKKWE